MLDSNDISLNSSGYLAPPMVIEYRPPPMHVGHRVPRVNRSKRYSMSLLQQIEAMTCDDDIRAFGQRLTLIQDSIPRDTMRKLKIALDEAATRLGGIANILDFPIPMDTQVASLTVRLGDLLTAITPKPA